MKDKNELVKLLTQYANIVVGSSAERKCAAAYFTQLAQAIKADLCYEGESLITHLRYCLVNVFTGEYEIMSLYECLYHKHHIVRKIMFFSK